MNHYVLGLDIGITSVGYGVIDLDNYQFVDYGVRLFKEGTAEDNVNRRTKRGSRRLKRRRQTRLDDMKELLQKEKIMSETYHSSYDPYDMRIKGLSQKLSNDELTCAILHITKCRGTTLEALDSADEDSEGTKSILSKNDQDLKKYHYVCLVQKERLKQSGKIRGTENNFKTDDYIKELDEILSHQDLSEDLCEKIRTIVRRRRQYYEGPGSEKSPTPYGRWIAQGVGPIDLIEKMRGKCSVFPDQLRAAKNSYTAELFNLLNDLNNLECEGEKLTTSQKQDVIDFVNEKGGITPKQLAKLLNVDLNQIKGFRIDKNDKPLLTEFKGYKAFKKIFDTNNCDLYKKDLSILDSLAEIVTGKKGIEERKQAIQQAYPEIDEAIVEQCAVMKGMTQYHSLSLKAMHLINQEMLQSPRNQMQVLHESHFFDKNRVSHKGQKHIEADDEAILSPVVKRAQRETFKVVNALREKYGEFESIVVETTRDRNSQEQKKRLNDSQKYYEQENRKVDELLSHEGYDPSKINGKTKLKVRLYLQQEGKTAYTNAPIDLNLLIKDATAYEVDHIIPLSISLDDSINNKALINRTENQNKSNMTPIYAILRGKLNISLDTYKTVVKNNRNYTGKKRSYLLYDKDITKFSNMQEFIARNLVDTSYACRVVMNTLSDYFKDNEISTHVHTVRGRVTNIFRNRINMQKEREKDYLHHAMDALIVASIKKLNLLNTYLLKYNFNDLYNEETGEVFAVGDDQQVLDPKYIRFITQLKTIYDESNMYYNGLIERNVMQFPPIKISHKIDTKPNRQISDETIYSTRTVGNEEYVVKKYSDIYDPKFTQLTDDIINDRPLDRWLMYRNDNQTFKIIQSIILDHFHIFKDDEKHYSCTKKKGQIQYALKGKNPLYLYKQEHGKVRKYAKKGNGPEITMMKYFDGKLGNNIDISNHYHVHNKKVVLLQISPYRTDFYVSPEGKYKMMTVRYANVFYKESKKKYVIDEKWYESEKKRKNITDDDIFVCSLHHDELIGIQKKDGAKYVYDLSTEDGGKPRLYHGEMEILKFTATNNDSKNIIEVKPIYTYCKKQLMISIGPITKLAKYATDVLGNVYEVKKNILKLEFE